MPIIAKSKGSERELVPSGNHLAICYRVIQLGTLTETVMGKIYTREKVLVTWEIPEEIREFEDKEGNKYSGPMTISKEYTQSTHEKANLRKDAEGWRGKGFTQAEAEAFDVEVLLGLPCMLNVIHKTSLAGRQRDEVASIAKVPKALAAPEPANALEKFAFDSWDQEFFETLPDWIKNKILSSKEYVEQFGGPLPGENESTAYQAPGTTQPPQVPQPPPTGAGPPPQAPPPAEPDEPAEEEPLF